MPTHKIPRATLHEDLMSLEREHEHVWSMILDPDDATVFVVETRFCGELERRGGAA